MLLHHEGGQGESEWLLDPSFEESQNLSNNLVLVTCFRPADAASTDMKVMIEKGSDALRTSYAPQLSSTLNFKPCSLTLG